MGSVLCELLVIVPGVLIHRLTSGKRKSFKQILLSKSWSDEAAVYLYGILFWVVLVMSAGLIYS